MMENRFFVIISIISCLSSHAIGVGGSGIFQYSVELSNYISPETGKAPVAYLWLPDRCKTIKAAILCQQNMTEERLLKMPAFQKKMKEFGVAMIWVAPAFSNNWDPKTACQTIFENMMVGLAGQSGHKELETVPIIPLGHSAQATFPWNFAAWNNDRTLCIISFHGDAPRTNLCGYGTANIEWGRTRNIDGIPGLMIEGEYEWWEARVRPALAFRMMYPKSCISFLCDTGRGHFDCSERTALYIAKFIEKAMQQRLQPDGTLKTINPKDGYLFSRYHSDILGTDGDDKGVQPMPFKNYNMPRPYNEQIDKENCFWFFDKEMADITYKRYLETHGKKRLYVGIKGTPVYDKDSITFHLIPMYTDSLGNEIKPEKGLGKLHIEYVTGPIKEISPNTFRVYQYESGWDNPKRSFSPWVVVVAEPTKEYKGAVQQVKVKLDNSVVSKLAR